jgi:hypothetical protein
MPTPSSLHPSDCEKDGPIILSIPDHEISEVELVNEQLEVDEPEISENTTNTKKIKEGRSKANHEGSPFH